jgi:HicB family
MNLTMYVEMLHQQLAASADLAAEETRALADQLATSLESAARLVLLEALSAAADEITRELAPGSVEVRLRGSNPDFVVTLPFDANDVAATGTTTLGVIAGGTDEGEPSRLNLRLPEALKTRIEESARREGLSLNAWLVRTAAAAVEGPQGQSSRAPSGNQRYTGWVS